MDRSDSIENSEIASDIPFHSIYLFIKTIHTVVNTV